MLLLIKQSYSAVVTDGTAYLDKTTCAYSAAKHAGTTYHSVTIAAAHISLSFTETRVRQTCPTSCRLLL